MGNRKLNTTLHPESRPQQRAVNRQTAQICCSPQHNPLEQVVCRLGDGSCANAHASTLNRATDAQPSRGGQSLVYLQRQYGNRYVQRVLESSRKGEGEAEASPSVEQAIQRARGSGQPLDSGVRAQMESAFGADFSGVRVHADAESDALNRSLNARAFTTGQDVFFRQAAYNPGSSAGRELLAHELTHVVQQNGDEVRLKLAVGQVTRVDQPAVQRHMLETIPRRVCDVDRLFLDWIRPAVDREMSERFPGYVCLRERVWSRPTQRGFLDMDIYFYPSEPLPSEAEVERHVKVWVSTSRYRGDFSRAGLRADVDARLYYWEGGEQIILGSWEGELSISLSGCSISGPLDILLRPPPYEEMHVGETR